MPSDDGIGAIDPVGNKRAGVGMGLEREDRRHQVSYRLLDNKITINLRNRLWKCNDTPALSRLP